MRLCGYNLLPIDLSILTESLPLAVFPREPPTNGRLPSSANALQRAL